MEKVYVVETIWNGPCEDQYDTEVHATLDGAKLAMVDIASDFVSDRILEDHKTEINEYGIKVIFPGDEPDMLQINIYEENLLR